MQLAQRKHSITEGRNLAKHVKAVGRLFGLGHGDKRRASPVAAVDPFRRDPETSRVQSLQGLADLVMRLAQREEALALGRESLDKGCGTDAYQMTRTRFQKHRLAAAQGLLLEPGNDCAGCHSLAGEEVGRPHQDPDLDPTRRQIAGHDGHEGGRACVVDAPGEDHVQRLRRDPCLDRRFQHATGLFPEDEARPRPDMPAALASFEYESTRAGTQILIEQAGRGHVQVGGDTSPFQFGRLIRPPPRDQGKRGPGRPHGNELLLAQVGRDEPEQAHAPRAPRNLTSRVFEQALDLGPAQERQRNKRQPSFTRHRLGKWGHIADAGHRALEDRQAATVSPSQGGVLGERALARSTFESALNGALERLHNAANRDVPGSQVRGQSGILPDGPRLSGLPTHLRADRPVPCLAALPDRLTQPGQNRRQRRRVHPNRGASRWLDQHLLAAIPGTQRHACFFRKRRLTRQQNGPFKHNAGRAGRHATRRHPRANSPSDPDRTIGAHRDRLQENERCISTDPPPCLASHGDQAVDPRIECQLGLGNGTDLAQDPPTCRLGRTTGVPELFRRPGCIANDRDQIRTRAINPILTSVSRMEAKSIRSNPELSHPADRSVPGVSSQAIQNAHGASPVCCDHKCRIFKVLGRGHQEPVTIPLHRDCSLNVQVVSSTIPYRKNEKIEGFGKEA